jgi:dihydrodipicolinate synthase/N-acetylneuraminate lyase
MLTREAFTGLWAGLPVAWTNDDQFDEATYRADVDRCCAAGIPGIYSGGTTGEFYAMELDEFKAVTRAIVEECHAHGTPAMVGCSSTYTLGAMRRAAYAAEVGADAIQVALPFWMEVGDDQIVPFFRGIAEASGGLPLSIYETSRAKKTLTLDQHRAIKDAVPSYMVVKANAGASSTPEGCRMLSQFINVFVAESTYGVTGPAGAKGSCSSWVYWNPRVTLSLWQQVVEQDWATVDATCRKITKMVEFLFQTFGPRGFTDTAYDRLGAMTCGFLKCGLRSRGPYPSATPADIELLRDGYRRHFPEMLKL